MDKKHIFPELTGLKGLFIWFIIWFHTAPQTPLFSSIPGNEFVKLYGGTLGNSMFFILSGFLLSWSYRDRIRKHSISFPDYICHRLRKLYSPYFLSIAVMILLNVLEYGFSAIILENIVLDMLLLSGGGLVSTHPYNGPCWFVSALFVCYLSYYLITYHTKHTTAYRCAIGVGIAWGYVLLCKNWQFPFCYSWNGIAFMNFYTGCVLAEIYPYLTRAIHRRLQPIALLILPFSLWLMLRYGVDIIAGDIYVTFAFVLCPLILYLSLKNTIFSRVLKSPVVLWLGNISIYLYFWHYVFYVGFRWVLRFWGRSIENMEFIFYVVILVFLCALPTFSNKKRQLAV